MDPGENNSSLLRERKVQLVKTTKIKELIDIMQGTDKAKRESGQYVPGPLAEEYAAKIMPKTRQGNGAFKLPIKPPTFMQYYEEDELANALKEMIQIDKDVETRKNQLALKSDFNLQDLYNVFDVDNKGHFDFRLFQEVYDLFKLYPETELLRLAFRHLDRDLDAKITSREFLETLAPKDKNYRDLVLSRSSIYNDTTNFPRADCFTPETQGAVVGLLRAMVQAEDNLEKVRRSIQLRRNFVIKDAFRSVDKGNKGHLNLEDIRDFLTSRYIFATDQEIQYLVDRFDGAGTGEITLNQFTREMRPKLLP